MPRPVYHQSPGNPLQQRLVPAQPTEIEFARHRGIDNDDAQFTQRVLRDLLFASVVGLGMVLVCGTTGTWYPITLLLLFLFVVHVGDYFAGVQSGRRIQQIPIFLGAWVYREFDMPLPLETAIATIAMALLAREIARHYIFVATVAPLDPQQAWAIRNASLQQTFATSLLLFPIGLGICFPTILLPAVLITAALWLAACLQWQVALPRVPGGFADAICSWCSYNRADSAAPGILQSPAGRSRRRCNYLVIVVLLLALLLGRLTFVPAGLPQSRLLDAALNGTIVFSLAWWLTLVLAGTVAFVAVPVIGVLAGVLIVGAPVFGRHRLPVPGVVPAAEWQQITARLRQSANTIERDSLYLGRLLHDQSPLLVPSLVFREHAHFLGDSGSGKTARGLAPLIRQLLARGDCSVMVIDMKGDSQELLQTLLCAAHDAALQVKQPVPVRYLTTRENDATFAFNPFALDCWTSLTVFQKTDILCGALGLMYGSEYGEGYYSSANAAVVYATLSHFPDIRSFHELGDRLGFVMARPKAHGLDQESCKAGNHVRMTVTRLASFPALNVTAARTPAADVAAEAIDPSRLFEQPEAHYFHLSSMLGPGSSPEIARLAIFMLLTSATLAQRKLPVYLVIDEFQRVATRNLDYLLQLARSVNVGVILANQSMEDLRRPGLIPVLETNCRYRQWFAVSGWDDQQRLCKASGETIDTMNSVSVSCSGNANGRRISVNQSTQEFIGPRLTHNDIKLVGEDDRRSIVLVSRGAGYCRYGGLPIVIESDFHITEAEFQRRRDALWPSGEPGTFVPVTLPAEPLAARHRGRRRTPTTPTLTEETIEHTAGSEPGPATNPGPFERYLTSHPIQIEDVPS